LQPGSLRRQGRQPEQHQQTAAADEQKLAGKSGGNRLQNKTWIHDLPCVVMFLMTTRALRPGTKNGLTVNMSSEASFITRN